MTVFPHVPPEVMTPRARAYLTATALYALGIGLACFFMQDRLAGASFIITKTMVPGGLYGWGVIHLMVFAMAIRSTWHGSQNWAIGALVGASGVVGIWAISLWWGFYTEPKVPPTGGVAYTFITIIHVIQARQPLRSPFDPVLRRINES